MKPQLFWKLMILCLFLVFKLTAAIYCVVAVNTNVDVPQNTTQVAMAPYQKELGFTVEGTWLSTDHEGAKTTWNQTTIPASGTTTLEGFEGVFCTWVDANVPWSVTVNEQNQ